jgi:predicted hotdog family 3-hydroxylacyl-ACP dehydratase
MHNRIVDLDKRYLIGEIVPHAGRMSLLDEMVSYDFEHIVVAATIRENSEFFESGRGVPAWIGIEYMAQAVAAFSGIEDVQAGIKPQIGLLLGTRRYTCTVSEFAVGMRLEIGARLAMRDESNLVAFHCEIRHAGKQLARADLKAVAPDDVHALVQSYANELQKD